MTRRLVNRVELVSLKFIYLLFFFFVSHSVMSKYRTSRLHAVLLVYNTHHFLFLTFSHLESRTTTHYLLTGILSKHVPLSSPGKMSFQQDEASHSCSEERAESKSVSTKAAEYSLFSLLKELHRLGSKAKFDHIPPVLMNPFPLMNRTYPQQIVLWDDFLHLQKEVWDAFVAEDTYVRREDVFGHHNHGLWSSIYWDSSYRISHEWQVRDFHHGMVEHAAQWIIADVHRNEHLRQRFGLAVDEKPSFKTREDRVSHVCIQRRKNEQRTPIFAIEFKAPQKLSVAELIVGVQEMELACDVIEKDPDDDNTFEDYAKRLVAAAITELYSYMLSRGVRHGYLFTGEAYLFVHIPHDDPSVAKCHLSIPSRDVVDIDDEDHLRRTAVAQVLAFTLYAMGASSPRQSWYIAASELDTWKVSYMNVLCRTPRSVRRKPPLLEYKLPALQTSRSPLQSQNHSNEEEREKSERAPREYCTMACLRGLVTDGALDQKCPNVQQHDRSHQDKHPFDAEEFIRHLQAQLDEDPDHGFEPLHIRGSTGFLVKATLMSHGYTVIIKATTAHGAEYLEHEIQVYNRLRPLQGFDVPMCMGELRPQPERPYWYHGEKTVRMLALSWAGFRLDFGMLYDNDDDDSDVDNSNKKKKKKKRVDHDKKHKECLQRMQALGVEVDDTTAWRNFLWNEELDRVVAIDFERFSLSGEPDGGQKRKRF